MSQKNVLITWKIMKDFILKEKLVKKNPNLKFSFYQGPQSLSEKKLLPIIHKYEGVICGDDEFSQKVLDKAKKLKVISKWGTGIDSIDRKYCVKKKIKLYNSPNAFTKGVAQYALALILAFSRSIFEINTKVKLFKWPKPQGFLLEDKTIGIIGFGKIGKRIGLLCKKFGCKIIFNDLKKIRSKFSQKSKKYVLKNSDILVIACNLNPSSYKLIQLNDFKIMKKTSGIINIARGPIIDEKSLILAMEKKYIKFFGLDVLEHEPLKRVSKLIKFKNCFLGSHNAFNTKEEVAKVNKNTFKNLIRGLQ